MLKISDLSENCYKSELDLFSVPPTQTAVESGRWDTILPQGGYEKNPNVDFRIPGDSLHYLDLSATEFYLKVNVVANNANTALVSTVGERQIPAFPVNNFLHSMFQDIVVTFNKTIVEQCQAMYPYRAYLEDLLNYDSESKNTFLQQQCFVKDEAGQFDNFSTEKREEMPELNFLYPTTNTIQRNSLYMQLVFQQIEQKQNKKRLHKHKKFVQKKMQFLEMKGLITTHLIKGKFHLDTFNMNNYLLNSVDVNLSLKKNNRSFFLMYDNDQDLFNVQIEATYLKVRRVVVSPSIMLNHAMALEKANAKYAIKKVLVKPLTLNFGATSQTLSNVHNGIMPNRISSI